MLVGLPTSSARAVARRSLCLITISVLLQVLLLHIHMHGTIAFLSKSINKADIILSKPKVFSKILFAHSPGGTADDLSRKSPSNVTFKTCKHCKKQFPEDLSGGETSPCTFHTGIFTGRLNRINDVDTSDLEYFWTCCGSYELSALGCFTAKKHRSVSAIITYLLIHCAVELFISLLWYVSIYFNLLFLLNGYSMTTKILLRTVRSQGEKFHDD